MTAEDIIMEGLEGINGGSSEVGHTSLTTHDFQSAPKSAAKNVAASKPRTLLDAVNEAAGVNCNLVAGDRCRHIGPLISVSGITREALPTSQVHHTTLPNHCATNSAAERLAQTFKQALSKSSLPPCAALQKFLMLSPDTEDRG
ncbi:hypothetical protein EMCRGX_G007291 [Ephydatia muelleri]